MKYREFLEHLQKFTNQKITQAECIGQSLYYGQMAKRQPACVLIMERGKKT